MSLTPKATPGSYQQADPQQLQKLSLQNQFKALEASLRRRPLTDQREPLEIRQKT
jgi:hypothetical protein